MKSMTLQQLADATGSQVRGDASFQVKGLATLRSASAEHISFLANERYRELLVSTGAGAVIMRPADDDGHVANALLTDNPYLTYARVAQLLDSTPVMQPVVHPTAVIAEGVELGANVAVGPYAVLEAGVKLADGVQIGAHCYLGEKVIIGENSRLWPNTTIYHGVRMGKHCTVHSASVIGSDGFGWATENGKWVKIPQLGAVVLGDHVDIGSGTTIDRGALDDTIVEDNCIIDNQVHIAHNVVIGSGTAIAGQVGIAGSTQVGRNCMIGGQAGLAGHIKIADGVQMHGQAMVTKSISQPGVYASGTPAVAQGEWARVGVRYKQLPELFKRVKALESKLKDD
ncbi:UDP-3-O-(3-hydroxymyristoyl)glucosamine N-acyltransferase [Aliidiomarina sedimenti]|uniref:UDP-3-O-acylglucosamine N-acyltransferase n=1 Tax=Aliidiomarina sedimenti TaxID=1933879 RepID=A0ABY0C2F5_9GAMM|nr:UDP-3-O-(3-hydroxymyristoyl)glucosamine N-acyltransferase [Aliidiomarina sedimenti]RUO32031.1 UDP-3-O-(3-hydroxymyristoyl)glucosamine N-acyltransferase [Aliidiomarina sedimenti]